MRPEIAVAAVTLAFAAYIDWKEHRVPNWLTFSAWGIGLLYQGWVGGIEGLEYGMIGSAVGIAVLILPYALNGMGAGDVKLMAAVGAWVGASDLLNAFLWIALIGGGMGLYAMIRSRQLKKRLWLVLTASKNLFALKKLDMGNSESTPPKILLPYGVPIAFGFYAYFLFGGLL